MGYKISNGYLWVLNEEARALPSAYQEVEYIQSSGTQYIDTGKTVSGDVKVEYTYMPNETQTTSSTTGVLFGMDNGWDSNGFGEGNQYLYYGTSRTGAGLPQADTKYDVVLSKQICSRGTFSYVPSSSYPSPSGTLKLFIGQRNGSINSYLKCKLYTFKRYDSGTLTQDLVPCYRKSDGVIGVYDIVNNQFYNNAGTGTFTKGGDIDGFVEKQFYPGSGGGYKPNANTLLYLPLDGDYLDKSSSHNDGTAVGTMSFGQIGNRQYASFGASSAIQLGTIPVGTGNPQPFTQSVWLKTTSSGVGYMHHFGVDSSHSRSCLITFYSSNHIPLQDMYGSSYDTYIGSATTSDLWNRWINLVYTYENGTHKLYINGVLRGTASNTINIGGTTNRYIGRMDANNGGYCMAECIFESVVWSAQEVLDYYNLTKSDFGL